MNKKCIIYFNALSLKQYFITDNSGLQYVTLWVMHLERSGKMSTIRRWSITVRLICGAGHEAIINTTSHFDWEPVSVRLCKPVSATE